MRIILCLGAASLWAASFLAHASTYKRFKQSSIHVPQHSRVYYVATKIWGRKACTISSGGFKNSRGRYWIASAIKIASMVSAAQHLQRHKIDVDTALRFRDRWGLFTGPLHKLFRLHNRDFDRLTRIGGPISVDKLRRSLRYPYLTVRTAYSTSSSYLRTSPSIHTAKVNIPRVRHPAKKAPGSRNCSSLFELQDLLRRIVMSDSSLQIPSRATAKMRKYLNKNKPHSWRGVYKMYPRDSVYNKSGSVPGRALIDNIAVRYGSTWLQVTASVPHPNRVLLTGVVTSLFRTLQSKRLCVNNASF